jgi:hypothetical protein
MLMVRIRTPLLIEISCRCLAMHAKFFLASESSGLPALMSITSYTSGEHIAELMNR